MKRFITLLADLFLLFTKPRCFREFLEINKYLFSVIKQEFTILAPVTLIIVVKADISVQWSCSTHL